MPRRGLKLQISDSTRSVAHLRPNAHTAACVADKTIGDGAGHAGSTRTCTFSTPRSTRARASCVKSTLVERFLRRRPRPVVPTFPRADTTPASPEQVGVVSAPAPGAMSARQDNVANCPRLRVPTRCGQNAGPQAGHCRDFAGRRAICARSRGADRVLDGGRVAARVRNSTGLARMFGWSIPRTRCAAAVVALLLAGCSSVVTDPDDGSGAAGGQGGAPTGPQEDPCSGNTTKDSCCSSACLWLEPGEGYPGICFSEERDCSEAECDGQLVCFGRYMLTSDAECRPNFGGAGRSFGACVEACPPTIYETKEFCRD